MLYNEPIWKGIYNKFGDVPTEGPGFDGEAWIEKSLIKIDALRQYAKRNTPLPPPSNYRESLLPMLSAMVYAEQKKLRILDFGGGIGFTYYQTMYALPHAKCVEYHIVERDAACKAGREFFGKDGENNIYFHEDIPQEDGAFDIVHLSSVIQYVEEWQQVLKKMCALSRKYLLLVDIYAGDIPTYVSAQNYYGSRIPMWFFNLPEFVQVVKDLEYELIFKSVYPAVIRKVEQDLPMQNLDEKYRLKHACNLLFVSRKVDTVFSSKDNQ